MFTVPVIPPALKLVVPFSAVSNDARVSPADVLAAALAACWNASTASKPYTPNALSLPFPMYFRKPASVLFDFASANGRNPRSTYSPFIASPAAAICFLVVAGAGALPDDRVAVETLERGLLTQQHRTRSGEAVVGPGVAVLLHLRHHRRERALRRRVRQRRHAGDVDAGVLGRVGERVGRPRRVGRVAALDERALQVAFVLLRQVLEDALVGPVRLRVLADGRAVDHRRDHRERRRRARLRRCRARWNRCRGVRSPGPPCPCSR